MEETKALEKVLEKLCSKNVRINTAKCDFGRHEIKYLGLSLNKDGVQPDKERLAPLVKVTSSRNHSELKSEMGSLQYYSRFIPSFARKAASLFELQTEKNIPMA